MKTAFSFLVLLTGSVALAVETADFSRYDPIVRRAPFGAVQGPGPAAPNWAERWQLVGATVSNAGAGPVQAILFDKEANRAHFRAEGETLGGGIVVVSIDTNQQPPKVVLKNGLETATLTYPERAAVASAPGVQQPPSPTGGAAPPPTIRRIPFRRGN